MFWLRRYWIRRRIIWLCNLYYLNFIFVLELFIYLSAELSFTFYCIYIQSVLCTRVLNILDIAVFTWSTRIIILNQLQKTANLLAVPFFLLCRNFNQCKYKTSRKLTHSLFIKVLPRIPTSPSTSSCAHPFLSHTNSDVMASKFSLIIFLSLNVESKQQAI